ACRGCSAAPGSDGDPLSHFAGTLITRPVRTPAARKLAAVSGDGRDPASLMRQHRRAARGKTMRKTLGIWLLAAGWLGGGAGPGGPAHGGASAFPRPGVTPDQWVPMSMGACVRYEPVVEQCQRVCYRPVTRTVLQPQTFAQNRTVYDTQYVPQTY